jgi:calcium-dependent protein kinase
MIGKYTLHQQLGKGGYSSVYKCTDEIGVRYACKMLPKERNKRLQVAQEICIMKLLQKSPKIVKYIDACEDKHNFYIIQEWCRGGSVHDYIRLYPAYGENTVASIVRGVLRGLCHMHKINIIHRDIKASNVFLGDNSEDADVKIGDFGNSLIMHEDVIEVDSLIGTPHFLAPENLRHVYHRSSDIWSVGVMTYQLLSGNFPFDDTLNTIKPRLPVVWKSILTEHPNFKEKEWKNISDDAKHFVSICLNKDAHSRPETMDCLMHPWLIKTDCSDRFKGIALTNQPFKTATSNVQVMHL